MNAHYNDRSRNESAIVHRARRLRLLFVGVATLGVVVFSTVLAKGDGYQSIYDTGEIDALDGGIPTGRVYVDDGAASSSSLIRSDVQRGYQHSAYPIGSDAQLDAETAAIYERNTVADGMGVYADSGNSRRTKSYESKDLMGYSVVTGAKDGDTFYERWIEPDQPSDVWKSQVLPQGLMYPSYLAGRKEPRLQSIITYEKDYGTLWDITLGGRAPIFRYGTSDPIQPEGWELELEGAALLRLDWERHRNLAATDYRAGVPIVYGTKRWQFKTGYYHVSSHLGDNYLMDAFRPRVHYSRDSIMLGLAFKPTQDVRLYAEMDYAFHCGQTTEPLEMQFGFEYITHYDPVNNRRARPFFATHGHLFQERDFGGYWATQLGAQWRGSSDQVLRLGAEFFVGGDDLYQFHHTYQRKIGGGLWYDF